MEPEQPYIARASRGHGISFSPEERHRHLYLLGKSGSGKSTALFNLAMGDLMAGEGVAVLDPHGDLAEALIEAMPRHRINQVCYLDVADPEFRVGFNPLAGIPPEQHALAASGIVSAFRQLWADSWGPRLEHFLFQGVAALLESPRPSLLDLARLYTDEQFRDGLTARIRDPMVARFWREEYPSYEPRFRAEAAAPILNKVGQFTASPILRTILGQIAPKFDLRRAMDHGGILIANLAKGRIGEAASNLLGSLLLSHLQLVAMARSELAAEDRRPFFVHVDEFQSFGTEAFASLLSEARKFAVHFVLANQFLEQVDPIVRAAVLGNAGTLLVFRVSAGDADILAPEFHPLPANELSDQWPYRAWLRGLRGHEPVALSPRLYAPIPGRREAVQRQSRRNFARRRDIIEGGTMKG